MILTCQLYNQSQITTILRAENWTKIIRRLKFVILNGNQDLATQIAFKLKLSIMYCQRTT